MCYACYVMLCYMRICVCVTRRKDFSHISGNCFCPRKQLGAGYVETEAQFIVVDVVYVIGVC